MSDLLDRLERCRLETDALRGNMPDDRWRGLLDELAAIFEEGRRHERNQDAMLREVVLVLSCTRAGRVLEMVMDSVVRLTGAQLGFLLLQREDGAQEIAAARNMERTSVATPEHEMSRRVVGAVLARGKALRLDDALNTPPYDLAESITRLKIVSVLCVPIKAGEAARATSMNRSQFARMMAQHGLCSSRKKGTRPRK